MNSRLLHTVDHVEGYLREEFDALDAFLCHTWAVTVTGAPKTRAIKFVEDMEQSPCCWYEGAVGMVGFDGSLNTLYGWMLHLATKEVDDGSASQELCTSLALLLILCRVCHCLEAVFCHEHIDSMTT